MVDTRGVLAIIAAVAFLAGMFYYRREREVYAFFLLGAGFALAAFWGLLGMALSRTGPTQVPGDIYLAMSGSAVVMSMYFFIEGRSTFRER
ncbi:hypothetical protein AUR64_09905 [Haloprofundus marisrubri]|uniref:Uncharacterized protein n=1 Tax=Haloprofundus marisrubri TaxID=1514971 RepID=A0A0W1R8R0_9EURY|nr:hypothetical protein [Haloprofundus marisrubri]KTG09929.1 hypothetical protein AUR64_09905 [Haloprofundus marisrubri]